MVHGHYSQLIQLLHYAKDIFQIHTVYFSKQHLKCMKSNMFRYQCHRREKFFFFLIKDFLNYFIFVQYSCLHLPSTSPSPHPSHLPPLIPSSLGFVHLSFVVVSENPTFLPTPVPPPTSLLVTVRLFLISMSLVIVCCLLVLLTRFHLKVRSYTICLSPPGLFHLA